LARAGIKDKKLWIHPDVMEPLAEATRKMHREGFDILINDAWRPIALYALIARKREEKGMDVKSLINMETMPHSTGKSIDIIPIDPTTRQDMITRNQPRDGVDSCFVGFYDDKIDSESLEYSRIQNIMLDSFLSSGFVLGPRKEYWHFELPDAQASPCF
jgi:D-alanyl-D-alanine dipeptidase